MCMNRVLHVQPRAVSIATEGPPPPRVTLSSRPGLRSRTRAHRVLLHAYMNWPKFMETVPVRCGSKAAKVAWQLWTYAMSTTNCRRRAAGPRADSCRPASPARRARSRAGPRPSHLRVGEAPVAVGVEALANGVKRRVFEIDAFALQHDPELWNGHAALLSARCVKDGVELGEEAV